MCYKDCYKLICKQFRNSVPHSLCEWRTRGGHRIKQIEMVNSHGSKNVLRKFRGNLPVVRNDSNKVYTSATGEIRVLKEGKGSSSGDHEYAPKISRQF